MTIATTTTRFRPTKITFVRNDELIEKARRSAPARAKLDEARITLSRLKQPLSY